MHSGGVESRPSQCQTQSPRSTPAPSIGPPRSRISPSIRRGRRRHSSSGTTLFGNAVRPESMLLYRKAAAALVKRHSERVGSRPSQCRTRSLRSTPAPSIGPPRSRVSPSMRRARRRHLSSGTTLFGDAVRPESMLLCMCMYLKAVGAFSLRHSEIVGSRPSQCQTQSPRSTPAPSIGPPRSRISPSIRRGRRRHSSSGTTLFGNAVRPESMLLYRKAAAALVKRHSGGVESRPLSSLTR